MSVNYLLDSNIVIYLFGNNRDVVDFLHSLKSESFILSIVTRLEVLVGAEKNGFTHSHACSFLDDFDHVVLDKDIVDRAIALSKKIKRKLAFKDLIIAATALHMNAVLVTADKDFEDIPELKSILFEHR